MGEKGSPGFGVLDLRGLPAKAWDRRFMDMVVEIQEKALLVKLWRESLLEKGMR